MFADKSLSALNAACQRAQQDLQSHCCSLGEHIVRGGAACDISGLGVQDTDISRCHALQRQRDQVAESILDIKSILQRQEELAALGKRVSKVLHRHARQERDVLRSFVAQYYATYAHVGLPALEPIYARTAELESTLQDLRAKRDQLLETCTFGSILERVGLQAKSAVVQRRIRVLEAKIQKIITLCTPDVIAHPDVERMYHAGELSSALSAAYARLISDRGVYASNLQHSQELMDEQEALDARLRALDCGAKPLKRVAAFTAQVSELDEDINALCARIGAAYASCFFTEEGFAQPPLSQKTRPTVPDELSTLLRTVAEARMRVARAGYQVECAKLRQKLQSEQRVCESFCRSIEEYRRGIKEYEAMIESAQQNVALSKATVARLAQSLEEASERLTLFETSPEPIVLSSEVLSVPQEKAGV